MIKKTNQYEMFKFRIDNREKIDIHHVDKLVESIKARNMLEFRPLIVNQDMEILDGQHRLLAAKKLGVDIYYQIQQDAMPLDVIKLNLNKNWTPADFLNFYVQQGNQEYIKLRDFAKSNNLSLKVALNIALGQTKISRTQFRAGEFKFNYEISSEHLEICWETIDYIRKMNGFSPYTLSARFWAALLKLINHPYFKKEKWISNMKIMVDKFSPKARIIDYINCMINIYNWRNTEKICLVEGEY